MSQADLAGALNATGIPMPAGECSIERVAGAWQVGETGTEDFAAALAAWLLPPPPLSPNRPLSTSYESGTAPASPSLVELLQEYLVERVAQVVAPVSRPAPAADPGATSETLAGGATPDETQALPGWKWRAMALQFEPKAIGGESQAAPEESDELLRERQTSTETSGPSTVAVRGALDPVAQDSPLAGEPLAGPQPASGGRVEGPPAPLFAASAALVDEVWSQVTRWREVSSQVVDFDMVLRDGQRLRVRMALQRKALRTTMVAESEEVCERVRRGWDGLKDRLGALGLRAEEPTFQVATWVSTRSWYDSRGNE